MLSVPMQLQEHRRIGETATDPKWAIGWKPAPTEAVTKLEDVVVSVGRSGAPSVSHFLGLGPARLHLSGSVLPWPLPMFHL